MELTPLQTGADCTLTSTIGSGASETIVKPPTPQPGASTTERKAYIDYQLDSMMGRSVLIVLRFLSGPSYRLYGGVCTSCVVALVIQVVHVSPVLRVPRLPVVLL